MMPLIQDTTRACDTVHTVTTRNCSHLRLFTAVVLALVVIVAEAAIPANDRTRKNIGIRALLRFSLEEILPRLARPVFSTNE
jgi:hypothetical protein